MSEAYIIDAVRTPTGRRGGGLSEVHPADLGAAAIKALLRRTGVDPMAIEDVIFGNLDNVGPNAGDIARTCWLAAGLPEAVPGVTVDRQCGSGQQAVSFAAMGVMAGVNDLVVAGGVQNMSMVPIGTALVAAEPLGHADPFTGSQGWVQRYGTQEVSQFRGAEMIAEKWDFSRADMEAYALESHRRAIQAIDEGRFTAEIEPVAGVTTDEGPRRGTSLEKMQSLPPLAEGGRLTAAVSSQISDGAAALLVASERAMERHQLTPRARVHHMSVRGDDPIYMLTGPIPATAYALERTGMAIDDFDLFEVQRSVRAGSHGLDARARHSPFQGQCQRRSHRAGPSAGLHRSQADDHPAARVGAHRRALGPSDDVRGRGSGQRHHHRAPVNDVDSGAPARSGVSGLAQGKVVLVTGAAGGIGRAAAQQFAVQGAAHVVVADLDAEGAHETAAAINSAAPQALASVVAVDVTDEAAVAAMVDGIVADHGRLDIAFNNAGISDMMAEFHNLDKARWDRMVAVNLTSVFLCMKHELRHMAEQGGGAIVNTSSGAGVVAAPGQPHYTAAKHGVVGLTKAAAQEYARRGIRVNAVLPGSTDTPMIRRFIGDNEEIAKMIAATNIGGRMLTPDEVAEVAVWLGSDAASMVNGQSLIVDGGGLVR